MRLNWSGPALRDLDRLFAFLAPKNLPAALNVLESLTAAADRLIDHPRLGIRLSQYAAREVRHIIVGDYDLRYEIEGDIIRIASIWHGRENR